MIKTLDNAITYFRVTSYVTGTFLMLLVIEMLVRYGLGYDFYAFGPNGVLTVELRPIEGNVVYSYGFNLSTAILIVHGWLYVAYLMGVFRLYTLFQWQFKRLIVLAAGGVVPMLSFFTERYFTRLAKTQLE